MSGQKEKTTHQILIYLAAVSGVLVIASLFTGPIHSLLHGFWAIQISPQALTVDACAVGGLNGALLNAGLLGFLAVGLFALTRAKLASVSIGAFYLTIGMSFFGKNCLNCWPIILGTWLCYRLQAVCVGVCFATGLAPIAGRWGIGWGVLAGALHACCVAYTPMIHGGFNVYNGGFTSGLVAIVLVPLLESFFHERAEKRELMDELREIAAEVRDPEQMN